MRRVVIEEAVVKTTTRVVQELIITDQLIEDILDYARGMRYVAGYDYVNGKYEHLTADEIYTYLKDCPDEDTLWNLRYEDAKLSELWKEHEGFRLRDKSIFRQAYSDENGVPEDCDPFAQEHQTRWENDYEGHYVTFRTTLRDVVDDFFDSHKGVARYKEISRTVKKGKPKIKRYD